MPTESEPKPGGRRPQLSGLPSVNYALLVAAAVVSLLIHFSSYISLKPYNGYEHTRRLSAPKRKSIKIRIVEKKPLAPDFEKKLQIIETPQKKTEVPEAPQFHGVVDHKATKQMRLKKRIVTTSKAQNAGKKGSQKKKKNRNKSRLDKLQTDQKNRLAKSKPRPPSLRRAKMLTSRPKIKSNSVIKFKADIPLHSVSRNAYERLLNRSFYGLQGEVDAGYQDYVDRKITEGDRIDLDTKEYRYIGYFTTLRKSIELVWTYPMSAVRRGLQGVVQLEFTIAKDGRVFAIKVLRSSNYKILDRAIVEALQIASPLPPLPESFGKDKVVITGSFNYVIQGYALGH